MPTPGISGKLNAKANASLMPNSWPWMRPMVASIERFFVVRWSHGLSRMNITALLVWLERERMSSPISST